MAVKLRAGLSPACRRARRRQGFTLVEAMVAITILALAGSVLLLAVDSSLHITTEAVDRTIADGLAHQLLDEITCQRYMEPGTSSEGPLGPSGWEVAGNGRERFNDTDDYHNFTAQPAQGIWGEPISTGDDNGSTRAPAFQLPASYFHYWQQRVEVYYVDAADPSVRLTSGTSPLRAIEVHIEKVSDNGTVLPLARRKKVIAFVPPPTY